MRLIGSYPGSRFAYALQDEKTYALTRYEWQDTLKDFNFEDAIIMEAIREVKKLYADVPTISQFVEIAQRKVKLNREKALMDEKGRLLEGEKLCRSEHQSDAAKKALEEIRKLCRLKTISEAKKR